MNFRCIVWRFENARRLLSINGVRGFKTLYAKAHYVGPKSGFGA